MGEQGICNGKALSVPWSIQVVRHKEGVVILTDGSGSSDPGFTERMYSNAQTGKFQVNYY